MDHLNLWLKLGGNPNNFQNGTTGASFTGGQSYQFTNEQAEELFRNNFGSMGGFLFGGNDENDFFGMGGNAGFPGMNGSSFRGRSSRGGDNSSFFGRGGKQQQQPRKLPPLVVEVPYSFEQLNKCVTRK